MSAGLVGGLLAGAVIGGLGGRLAMFVLRLTSDPSLRGAETDDGFIIGRVTGATGFLVALTAVGGILGGLLYLIVRPWILERLRPGAMGVVGGIVGGAVVIRPGGIDFTLLEPLALAVAMFIALPALYGVGMSLLVERLLRGDSMLQRSQAWTLGLIPLIALGLLGLRGSLVLVGMLAAWVVARTIRGAGSVWRSAPTVWIGRAGLLTATGFALVALVKDVGQIL